MKLMAFVMSFLILSILFSCSDQQSSPVPTKINAQNESDFTSTLTSHINAVGDRDLATLKNTLSPNGEMQLILEKMEIIESVDSFMKFHEDWFADTTTTWTMESKILNANIGNELGFGIVESIYKEPLRNGVPYFNRLIVSYDLKKINGNWKVIKDHATSAEKSTD